MPALIAGMYSLGITPPTVLSSNSIRRRFQRGEFHHAVTVLTVTAGLANVTAFALDGAGYGLAVCDLRTADLALNVELAYKPIHDYFKVKFAHAAYYGLARFLIGKGTEGGVLIGKLCKRKAHLFLAGLGFGLYGHLYNRIRNLYGFKQQRMLFIAKRIARAGLLQSAKRSYVARVRLGNFGTAGGMDKGYLANALALTLGSIVNIGI